MSANFEFNAPQYINFLDLDDPKADKFFDTSIQCEEESSNQSSQTKSVSKNNVKQSNSENKDPSSTLKNKGSSCKKGIPVLRNVLHELSNCQNQNNSTPAQPKSKDSGKDFIQQLEKLHLSEGKSKSKGPVKATEVFSGVKNVGSERKSHHMITRLDTLTQKRSKSESKIPTPCRSLKMENTSVISHMEVSSTTSHNSSKPAAAKMEHRKRLASPLNNGRKFISLAEQVEHFYKDTPARFRSKSKYQPSPKRSSWTAKPNCIPKTPNLTTKFRSRKVDFPDRQQREEMELEEIKKHQIKAHPLNEKILMGPSLNLKVPIIKKSATIPQPFSLTEVKKKEPPKEQVFHFKAQPVPTNILQGPVGIPPKRIMTPTRPNTPQIKVPMRYRVEVKTPGAPTSQASFNPGQKTKIEPFSFDERMKDLLQKKEEFIKKVIEEEKKICNSFKAHPMPDFKSKVDQTKSEKHRTTIPQPFNLTQPKMKKSSSEEQITENRSTPFKARPAAVVHQKPFIPKLNKNDGLQPLEIQLNTQKRAAERQKFDEKIKQKEAELALVIKHQQEEEERLEREKMLEERKKAEFKAKPVPRYKAFEIHASDPENLTRPQSPLFSSKLKQIKKLEDSVAADS